MAGQLVALIAGWALAAIGWGVAWHARGKALKAHRRAQDAA